jgi:hypothetical protein
VAISPVHDFLVGFDEIKGWGIAGMYSAYRFRRIQGRMEAEQKAWRRRNA